MVNESVLLGLGLVIVLGISLQWLARLIKIPGIVLLLPGGMVVGPILGLVDPDEIFGESLFPLVSIGVGILLLNGGLKLRLRDLRPDIRVSVLRLIALGAILTSVIGTIAVMLLISAPVQLALLMATILVVSGPTVIGPILRYSRPREPLGSLLLWEGVIIDPIGAALGVAAVSLLTAENPDPLLDLLLTGVMGVAFGLLAALVFISADRNRRIPGDLSALIALMLGVAAIVAGELIFSEAGLFAALTMGLVIANQRLTPFGGVQEFTETLEPLIIGILFIILAALVDLSAMTQFLLPSLGLVAVYVLIARPAVSFAATFGCRFTWREKMFIGALHPRGIVAAATASLFSLSLANVGVAFPQLVPMVFAVILATVIIYGLGTPLLSKRLGLAESEPNGVAVFGDQPWVFGLAESLHKAGAVVMLLTPGQEKLPDPNGPGSTPYVTYAGSISDLGDEDILDEAHEFKTKIRWLIIASSDVDDVKLVADAFKEPVGLKNMILFGTRRARQDEMVLGGRSDILAKTPFGLFGRNEDELLKMLEGGGGFEAIDAERQPREGGVPTDTKPFLRVSKDGTLAVPGTDSRLEAGEFLIVVRSPKANLCGHGQGPSGHSGS